MTREETIDKIIKELGGKPIEAEEHEIDFEEVRDLIVQLFSMFASMNVSADSFKDKRCDEYGKWFATHMEKGLVIIGDFLTDLSAEIFGENATEEIINDARRITKMLFAVEIDNAVNKEVRESDLN